MKAHNQILLRMADPAKDVALAVTFSVMKLGVRRVDDRFEYALFSVSKEPDGYKFAKWHLPLPQVKAEDINAPLELKYYLSNQIEVLCDEAHDVQEQLCQLLPRISRRKFDIGAHQLEFNAWAPTIIADAQGAFIDFRAPFQILGYGVYDENEEAEILRPQSLPITLIRQQVNNGNSQPFFKFVFASKSQAEMLTVQPPTRK